MSYTLLFRPSVFIRSCILVYLDGKYYSWDTKHKGCEVQQSQDGSTDDRQDEEVMWSRVVGSGDGNWLELSRDLGMGMES